MPDSRFLRIGLSVSRQVRPLRSYSEIGRELGLTPQMTYYFANVALGKIVYRLRAAVAERKNA